MYSAWAAFYGRRREKVAVLYELIGAGTAEAYTGERRRRHRAFGEQSLLDDTAGSGDESASRDATGSDDDTAGRDAAGRDAAGDR